MHAYQKQNPRRKKVECVSESVLNWTRIGERKAEKTWEWASLKEDEREQARKDRQTKTSEAAWRLQDTTYSALCNLHWCMHGGMEGCTIHTLYTYTVIKVQVMKIQIYIEGHEDIWNELTFTEFIAIHNSERLRTWRRITRVENDVY